MNLIGMKNAGFEILQAEVYNTYYEDDLDLRGGHDKVIKIEDGIALGYSETKEEFVTWQFSARSNEDRPSFFWGHYFDWKDGNKARMDYHNRLLEKYEERS